MGRPSKELKLPEKLPEWFAIMPDDAMLGYNEIGSLLSCDRSTVQKWKQAGKFPEPDMFSGFFRASMTGKSLGKKSTIIRHFEGKHNG